eukprot:1151717-Pelagomonas_calceolata.AAC.5
MSLRRPRGIPAGLLKHRLRAVWRDVKGVNPRDTYCKLATYQSLFAVPFDHNVRALVRLPRHMHLDLSQHVMRNVSRFRLRAHTLKVETAAWDTRDALLCDRSSLEQPCLQQVSVQAVHDFLLQHNNKLFSFVSELDIMDIMLAGEDQSQADQPNSLG